MSKTGDPEMTPLGAAQMVTDGLTVLCRADAGGLDAGTLAELLLVLEQADSMAAAARANILGAFTTGLGYESDGHAGPVPWLMDQAQATRGRARAQVRQGKKLRAHPQVAEAMAAGRIMGSWAEKVMEWTGRLPADSREAADEILLGAAAGGARLEDLAALACTMYELAIMCPTAPASANRAPHASAKNRARPSVIHRSLPLATTRAGKGKA
jgi:hypothetical protein